MLNYDHSVEQQRSRELRQASYDNIRTKHGFGSNEVRFPKSTNAIPGVGSYDILPQSTLNKSSPSISKKGYLCVSNAQKQPLFPNNHVPGPNSYRLNSISDTPDRKRPSTSFIPSGKGRVPFPPPEPIPGPLAYVVNYEPGRSKMLDAKKSSTFVSKSKRDSFFNKMRSDSQSVHLSVYLFTSHCTNRCIHQENLNIDESLVIPFYSLCLSPQSCAVGGQVCRPLLVHST